MDVEAAGSVGPPQAASESHNSSGDRDESLQQGGSVNYGAAQSPRVPRSQISRAHPPHNPGFGERTSAVLSALSGDDETALSAAEAAGEHTSEPQYHVAGQPAHSLTAPAPRRGRDLAGSPPASTSPIYRANSVVSYTAAPAARPGAQQQQQQQQQQQRRGAETPASVAAAAHMMGTSPNTSRGEFSAAVPQPRGPRRAAGAFSAGGGGLPPTSGHRHSLAQQYAAAGPSRPSLSGNQPHAAVSLPSTLAVAPSQQGPATSARGQLAHAPSSLATVSTGNGERAGGSVEMSAQPSRRQGAQHATSAPAACAAAPAPGAAPAGPSPPSQPPGHVPGAPLQAAAGHAAHAAASAPAAVPPQGGQPGGQATPPAQPAVSASMSGQGDTPGQPYGAGALPQSSAAAPPLLPVGHAAPQLGRQQQQQAAGGSSAAPPAALPAHASTCEGHGGRPPFTDARSRSQGNAAAGAAGASAAAGATGGAAAEGMGSPAGSTLAEAGRGRDSQGTARGTILAGAAHSILTTAAAAAGEGEAMDEGGEALSPLLAAKALLVQAPPGGRGARGASPRPAPTPRTGSVGVPLAAPAPARSALAAAALSTHQQQPANGFPKQPPQPAGSAGNGFLSPINLSTMAVDLAPAGADDAPQPSASGQPSSLPPPGAVAAALAALEQQQAAQDNGLYLTPPPAELGELYHVLQQQNGYATHANSAIGNGGHSHAAQGSPDRELTSPSRLLTHDSTAGGSASRSKQAAKRRRTSAGPSGSTQHA
ncbi:hypothetical protein CHLNCDRAFT_135331 [Chlorella variabilis]|uniref:Uncharacterized protein n=1 Tax=Chlorella variabilis TaxID=554065 RepID=E1ZI00_CHLVA|nr:hypothetical protein CHLNCDRAFT_135331 [Chlorella variabilis]EFN54546.1 hypothetical protein CHLNCDRAFT_135331 [Chlorella variabilis]|eukprot:XP_005846648.1 hypothetical protein CHLNCDRAFT_135331 [Chlorella variabilis]